MNKAFLQKAGVVAALTCVILIALYRVSSVIDDRQRYRKEAVHAIELSYAGPQVVIGPVLVCPYTQIVNEAKVNDRGSPETVSRPQDMLATSFPEMLDIRGTLQPSERRRGLYKVLVYEFQGNLTGHFNHVESPQGGQVTWGEPYLALSIADVRGIIGTPRIVVNGVAETMLQGAPPTVAWQPNLHVPLRGVDVLKGPLNFSIELTFAGTETLGIAPVGDSNHLELSSAWTSPLFSGQFLPKTRQTNGGFTAQWNVSSLASGTQAQLKESPFKSTDLINTSLKAMVDPYTLSSRAVKYGILFIALTFGGFFLFELLQQAPIHPVQYLLVGFGLCIFFLLLVSFSEHLPFGTAYLAASIACIGLLTCYLCFVLRSARKGLGFGVLFALLYSSLYGLLISEDNALILGSVMLFVLLAAIMFVTRNVDWYRSAAGLTQAKLDLSAPGPPATPQK